MRIKYRPCVVVLTGPPLHGKSRAAELLASRSNFHLVDVDHVRSRHFPRESAVGALNAADPTVTERAYAIMVDEIAQDLNRPVVVAGAFSKNEFKAPLLVFMRRHPAVPLRVFRLEVSTPGLIKARIDARANETFVSPIRTIEQYEWALTLVRPWPTHVLVVPVNTDSGSEPTVDAIVEHITDLEV